MAVLLRNSQIGSTAARQRFGGHSWLPQVRHDVVSNHGEWGLFFWIYNDNKTNRIS